MVLFKKLFIFLFMTWSVYVPTKTHFILGPRVHNIHIHVKLITMILLQFYSNTQGETSNMPSKYNVGCKILILKVLLDAIILFQNSSLHQFNLDGRFWQSFHPRFIFTNEYIYFASNKPMNYYNTTITKYAPLNLFCIFLSLVLLDFLLSFENVRMHLLGAETLRAPLLGFWNLRVNLLKFWRFKDVITPDNTLRTKLFPTSYFENIFDPSPKHIT